MDVEYVVLYSFLIISSVMLINCQQRTKEKMYDKIDAANGCYRRLNATHQIGCTSKRGGSTGVIHYCRDSSDLDFVINVGTAGPYVPVLPTKLFIAEIIEKLITSQKVSGLILHPNNETLDYFTHENQCPNPLTSVENTCGSDSLWNPHGTGLLYRDIPFPIFYVESEDEITKIRKCFDKFNNFDRDNQKDRSLCSLELKSFMYATTNSQTCRRRSNIVTNLNPITFCDPLGDNNIWAALYPLVEGPQRNETEPVRDFKYIVIAARMDTTSMFEKTAGANSPVTGIITLLHTAKLLKSLLKQEDVLKAKTNVLFILFNGETYDYLGSQRMLYDMENGNFPVKGLSDDNNILPVIRPENISLFIELSQLGNSKDNNLYVHYLKSNAEVDNFSSKLQLNNNNIQFHDVPTSLPPSSLNTFLKHNPGLPGLVISDHEKSYTNLFYNSIYDNSSNIEYQYYNVTKGQEIPKNSIQQFITNVSEVVAKSVYEEIMAVNYTGNLVSNVELVNELFHCYLEDPNCKVHSATQKGKLPKAPLSLYVGVDRVAHYISTMTSLTLGWFTGDVEGEGNINCTNKPKNYAFRYYNMSKSIDELTVTLCFKITMNLTEAKSPAFIIEDYDWSSGLYSSWTESVWVDMGG
ncbi:hypothetical protein NQ315_013645 [Exocentrus adspersus]|uniref:Nicastrin n=1 Tax=Exocentrus adspersus TaxID=1586481 RepID=A0AAV8W3C7_9CUCU|nr:hypothetical protein NQ315_013645 [Exocentrus adspersus]